MEKSADSINIPSINSTEDSDGAFQVKIAFGKPNNLSKNSESSTEFITFDNNHNKVVDDAKINIQLPLNPNGKLLDILDNIRFVKEKNSKVYRKGFCIYFIFMNYLLFIYS